MTCHLLNRMDSPPLPMSNNAASAKRKITGGIGKLMSIHVAEPPHLNAVAACSLRRHHTAPTTVISRLLNLAEVIDF